MRRPGARGNVLARGFKKSTASKRRIPWWYHRTCGRLWRTPARRPAFEPLEPRVVLNGGALVISELLAVNDSGLADGGGDRSDWIEIYNPSDAAVNLGGWYLTDRADHLTKWQFPPYTLGSGAYLVVFASEKDADGPPGQLHTNFKISGDGEYLALVRPDGTTVVDAYAPQYPPQVADVSYGAGGTAAVEDVLVHEGAPVRALIPADDSLGSSWREADFDDSGWIAGDSGVGYEKSTYGVSFEPYIETDVEAQMYGSQTTAYIRETFELADPADYASMTLRMRYDDGFVAYLNGQWIAERNVQQPLSYDSNAFPSRSDSDAVVFEEIDVSAYVGLLQAGDNVLAIHGLNRMALDTDFLIMPELVAEKVVTYDAQYYATPTPGSMNLPGAAGKVADTTFSVDRGFFDEPFSVRIGTKTSGAEIRYTTDGSPPTATTGSVYTGPITIDETTTLRAAAFRPGWIPTNVDTQTYVFVDDVVEQDGAGLPGGWGKYGPDYAMDPEVVDDVMVDSHGQTFDMQDALLAIPTVSLTTDLADFFGSGGRGIYLNGQGSPRGVSVELLYPDGREGFQIDASVQIQGGTSVNRWKSDKLSMRLKFWEPYGPTSLDFPLFGDDAADDFDTLILDARLNQAWHYGGGSSWQDQQRYAQYTRDQFVADLQRALGGTSPHGISAHLYINGIYWGIYRLHERPDESFAREYFGGEKDTYYVIKHQSSRAINPNPQEDPAGAAAARANFAAMFGIRGISTAGGYAQMQQYLDVPDFIDYMITNYYVANSDWSHQNWYATRNAADPQGRWRFHSWDAEHVLKEPGQDVTGRNNAYSPTGLHQLLMTNGEYRMLFADHIHRHFFNDGALTPDGAAALYQVRLHEIDRAVAAESARWGDNQESRSNTTFTRGEHWIAERGRLLGEFFPARTGIVLGQFRSQGWYPQTVAPAFRVNGSSRHGGGLAPGDVLTATAPAGTIFYTLDGTDPRLPGGAISPAAVSVASGSMIPLAASARVKTRVYDGGTWSALNEAQFYLGNPATAENLAIAEIHYNPHAPTAAELARQSPGAAPWGNDDFEFIELINRSDTETIDLSGVRFIDAVEFDFDDGAVKYLAPNRRVVVVRDRPAFEARYGTGLNVAGEYAGSLSNDGEEIVVYSEWTGQTLHHFAYNDAGGWPGRADGRGASLELIDPANTDPADYGSSDRWNSSVRYGGTPGTAAEAEVGVVINEVLTHTDIPQVDAIELHNTTAAEIDLGGWYLSDRWGWASDPGNGDYQKFRIPDGTKIAPRGYLVFYEGHYVGGVLTFHSDEFGFGQQGFALNGEQGENVWLMKADAAGNLTHFVDHVEFPAAANGESFGRWPDAAGKLFPMSALTLGYPNSRPRIGPLIFSEVMYHPTIGADGFLDEFVELYNATTQSVPLYDPLYPANTWKISGLGFGFPEDTVVPPGGVVLVVPTDTDTFRTAHDVPPEVQVFGPYSGALDNAGERIRLLRPDVPAPGDPPTVPYLLVDEADYKPDGDWPAEADGAGDSLHRRAADLGGSYGASWIAASASPGAVALTVEPSVAGRHVFYNRSSFDGNDPGIGAAEAAAVAVDKIPLLPGHSATFANYTSFQRGINGVIIDVFAPAGVITADDFRFHVGNDNRPDTWAKAPPPADFQLQEGAGPGNSDRVVFVWDDFAIRNQWLRVTILGNNIGLPTDDVFYFGNVVAESGNSAADARVCAADLLLARNNPRGFLDPAGVDCTYDFNRDGRVNVTDVLLARNNQTAPGGGLQLIDLSAPAAAATPGANAEAAPEADALQAAWLREFDPLDPPSRPARESRLAGEDVDALLATYWP